MKMFSIWKLLRKIQRIRIRGPFISQMPLTIWTWNIPPPVICVTQVRNRENIPGWISPFTYSCRHTLGHTRHVVLPRYALWCYVCFIFTISPSSSLVDPETAADVPGIYYVTDDPSFLSEKPGKQTLLEHSDIAHFFPSHACIRTATAFCMILLWCITCFCYLLIVTYLLILNRLV